MRQLQFRGPLNKTGISAAELHERLREFQKELSETAQGDLDTSQLDAYCQELIKPTFLRHKHKGIQAIVACILADMLRLYAPNAPFSSLEIKVRACMSLVDEISYDSTFFVSYWLNSSLLHMDWQAQMIHFIKIQCMSWKALAL